MKPRVKYKIIGEMLSRPRFTPTELAEASGAKLSSVRTVLQRTSHLLEQVGEMPQNGPGSKEGIYAIRQDRLGDLRETLEKVYEELPNSIVVPNEPQADLPDGLVVAEAALLEEFPSASLDRRENLIKLAELDLAVARKTSPSGVFQGAFRQVGGLVAFAKLEACIDEGKPVEEDDLRRAFLDSTQAMSEMKKLQLLRRHESALERNQHAKEQELLLELRQIENEILVVQRLTPITTRYQKWLRLRHRLEVIAGGVLTHDGRVLFSRVALRIFDVMTVPDRVAQQQFWRSTVGSFRANTQAKDHALASIVCSVVGGNDNFGDQQLAEAGANNYSQHPFSLAD
jgi:hypothetical protein